MRSFSGVYSNAFPLESFSSVLISNGDRGIPVRVQSYRVAEEMALISNKS